MPDEAPAAEQETPESPDAAAPDGTPAESTTEDSQQATDNYQERYEQLRPEYTRATQRLSEYERFIEALQNPETANEALQAFGYQLDDGEDEETFDDGDPWEDRFERIEQALQSQAEEKATQELMDLEQQFEKQELKKLDPEGKFSDEYRNLVKNEAFAYADEDGIPDYEAAHEALQAMLDSQRKEWVQSKRTPQVQSGASASHSPDLDDPEQRRDYMARRLADMAEGAST